MNIALLTQYYKPEMGAPQNRLHEMVTGLKKKGCRMTVITALPNYPTGRIFNGYRRRFSITEDRDGVTVKRYWLYPSNSKRTLPRVFNMLSFSFTALFAWPLLRRKNIDLLIVESPPLLPAFSGWILSRLTGARLISNISDVWPLSARAMGAISDGFLYRFLERLEKFIYRRSALCMGQSSEIVEHLEGKGCRAVYLFRNGVDPARFNEDTTMTVQKNETLKIVYAGLLGFAQGILDICKNINFRDIGCEFHIYGAGGEEEQLIGFLQQNPGRGILFHGRVSPKQIPLILQKADATLIPLAMPIFGAVPSKIYESMAAGVPILFAGDGEGARIIKENELGWVSPSGDHSQLTANIEHLKANPLEVEGKKENCRKAAHDKFNRPRQVNELYHYLQRLV